jgi:peptidoglycan/xylan/chitin deacetylase (PgdA/CDA1 family)
VISLDFELRWGVFDHCPPGAAYERNLRGAREVVPRMLALFEEFGVAATWATVGFLFARTRAEREAHRPALLPGYGNAALLPYDEVTGESEADDPLHYAPGLIERILATPRQELATHTFSHFFCTEAGQTREQFRADLAAARAIAAPWGVELRSIVFPRNQHNPDYDAVLREAGIVAYRGNPEHWMWRFADARESAGRVKRAARLADAYLSVTGDGSVGWDEVRRPGGLADVRASFLVRPFTPRLRHLEPLRLRRMRRAVHRAARRRRIVHLWWHPHNFGAHPDECLRFLRGVLEEFARCRERYGMASLSMAEVAEGSGGAGERGSRGAGEQGSRGAGEQGSRGAGEQGSRGAGG